MSFISGGISNALYKVAIGGDGGETAAAPRAVAFRVYGTNTDKFVDRARELGLMQLLHSHGFGPQVGRSLWASQNSKVKSEIQSIKVYSPQNECNCS